ncbi:MAG: YbjN domain-containing protein [Parvularculales bacterium]
MALDGMSIHNPLDMIEQLASGREWLSDRRGDAELILWLSGAQATHELNLYLGHNTGLSSRLSPSDALDLQAVCLLDLKISPDRNTEALTLLAHINARLWFGHFDLWIDDGVILFRYGLTIESGETGVRQCEALIQCSYEACETYTPAFHYLSHAEISAEQALAACMFETAGEA